MGRREKQVSQQGWKIYSRVEETFLATSPHGFLPSQIYSTHSIISSSLQEPCSWSGARESHTVSPPALPSPQGGLPVPRKRRHRKFSLGIKHNTSLFMALYEGRDSERASLDSCSGLRFVL